MSPRHLPPAAAVLAVVLAAAGCGDSDPARSSAPPAKVTQSPPPSPTARLGVPVRAGAFEVTVTAVESMPELPTGDVAASGGVGPYRPTNGKFVLIRMSVKNVSPAPATPSSTTATFTDTAGKTFSASGPYSMATGQGLDTELQPDTTKTGFVAFDVPATAQVPAILELQTDPAAGTTTPTVLVVLR